MLQNCEIGQKTPMFSTQLTYLVHISSFMLQEPEKNNLDQYFLSQNYSKLIYLYITLYNIIIYIL